MTNQVSNDRVKNPIDRYLGKIEKLLLFPKKNRLEAITILKQHIEETMEDSGETKPLYAFGLPRKVAKNFSLNYNWNFEYISFEIRTLAYIIDLFISILLFYIFAQFMDPILGREVLPVIPGFIQDLLLLTPLWLFSFSHQIILEVIFATTIGKRIFGLIVCDKTGIRMTWKQSVVRNLTKFIPGLVAFEIIAGRGSYNEKQQRLLDTSAHTIVVRMRKDETKLNTKNNYKMDIGNYIEPQLDSYYQEIEKWLPYPKEAKIKAMQYLRQDIEDAMKDSNKLNPEEVFGLPYDVVKNYSKNYAWRTTQAGYGVRAIAFVIDAIFSYIFFLYWLKTLNVLGTIIAWGLIESLFDYVPFITRNELWFGLLFSPFVFFTIASLWLISLGHPMIFERYFSTSIGKKFLGIIVCDQSGIRITWKQAFIRNITKLIPGLVIFEVIATKFSPDKEDQRRFMDKMAETDVKKISEKTKMIKLVIILGLFLVVLYWSYDLLGIINSLLYEGLDWRV